MNLSITSGNVHIVVALMAEARPLIRYFNLVKISGSYPFLMYGNDQINLIISGVGKFSSASACGFLQAQSKAKKHHVWLNIGVSGSKTAPLGSIWMAHKVIEKSSLKVWYPQILRQVDCPQTTVITVDEACNNYAENSLLDMEAAGFCAACSKFAFAELTHVIKIVSDNENHSYTQITKQTIDSLIHSQITVIAGMIQKFSQSSDLQQNLEQVPHEMKLCEENWHFTTTQKHQLLELLRRWRHLYPKQDPMPQLSKLPHAKAVINALRLRVEDAALQMDGF